MTFRSQGVSCQWLATLSPSMRNPRSFGCSPVKIGIFRKRASVSWCRRPIKAAYGLVFSGPGGKIRPTHSPCPSRFAVTHIKGEFLFCAPPYSQVEERT